jgi:hypothetical protein
MMRGSTAALVTGVLLSCSAAAKNKLSADALQDFFLGHIETPCVPEEPGRLDLVMRGGGTPEFRLTILPAIHEGHAVYRVDVVDLHETTQFASWRFEEEGAADLSAAWDGVSKTEARADTGGCVSLLEPVRLLQMEFIAAKNGFSLPTAERRSENVTLHPSIVQFSATDESFVRLHIETQNNGPPALMLAADRVAQALSACSGERIRALVEHTSKE